MNNQTIKILSGHILEEEPTITLSELCISCQTPEKTIIKLMSHGIIAPCTGTTTRQWRFHQNTLIRTHKALRLQQDLRVNLAGIALALELLDEIDGLRKKLIRMEKG